MRKLTFVTLVICIALTGFMSAPTVYAAARTTQSNQQFWVTSLGGAAISAVIATSAHHQVGMTYYKIPKAYNGMTQIHYFLVHGHNAPDGMWHYRFTVHMSAGVRAESVEIGQNTKAHVEVVAVGIQPSDSSQPLTNASTADLASVVYDPANLQLIQVFDYLTYYWNGTCVTGIYAHFPATRLYPDGWFIASESPSDGMAVVVVTHTRTGCMLTMYSVRRSQKYTSLPSPRVSTMVADITTLTIAQLAFARDFCIGDSIGMLEGVTLLVRGHIRAVDRCISTLTCAYLRHSSAVYAGNVAS